MRRARSLVRTIKDLKFKAIRTQLRVTDPRQHRSTDPKGKATRAAINQKRRKKSQPQPGLLILGLK